MQCSTATETAKDLTTRCPEVQIVTKADPAAHAVSLDDVELLNHLKSTFHTVRENLPYLREARDRFAVQGQRLPVEGKPTWSQWVSMNLHVTVRTVQRWLAPPKEETEKKPRVKKQRGVRPNLQLRDWPEAQRKANDLVLAVKRLKEVTCRRHRCHVRANARTRRNVGLRSCEEVSANPPPRRPTKSSRKFRKSPARWY